MKNYKLNDFVSFNYLDPWILENDENIVSVYNPKNGFGVLQFSVYEVHDADDLDLIEEFNEYILERHIEFEVNRKEGCLYTELSDDGVWWRYWLFRNNNVLLFATYNCDIQDKEKEDMYVDKIVGSALR